MDFHCCLTEFVVSSLILVELSGSPLSDDVLSNKFDESQEASALLPLC